MTITEAELKANLDKYLALAATEDVFIIQHNKVVARLTAPIQDRVETAKSLFGILPQKSTFEEAQSERLEL